MSASNLLEWAKDGDIFSSQIAPANRQIVVPFGPIDFDTAGANTSGIIFVAHSIDYAIAGLVFAWQEASDATDNFGTLLLGAAGEGDTLDADGIHLYTTLTAASTAIHKVVQVKGNEMAGAEASARRTSQTFKGLPILANGESLWLGSTKHGAGHNDGIIAGGVILYPVNDIGKRSS